MNFDIGGVISNFLDIIFTFIDTALSGLPTSPVQGWLASVEQLPYLGYINWFCPVGTCLQIMSGWLVCVGSYYLFSVVMRWVKVIQ